MKTYKPIQLYDATTKRNKSILIKSNDFKDNDEIENYIKQLRDEQKKINKLYKEGKLLLPEESEIKVYEEPKLEKPIQFKNIIISPTIELKLDANTGNTCCIYGSSKTGKSSLLMHLYNKYYPYNDYISTLFSINSHIGIYGSNKTLLKSNCFNQRSEKYIKLQKYINSRIKQKKNQYKFLNMFDDIIDTKHTKLVNQLIMTYRNSNISTIICLQYVYLLSKMNRANTNNIIIFDCNTNESCTDIIKTFLKPYFLKLGFKQFEQQMQFFKYITNNHGFFYINPNKDSISFHRINI